MKQILKYIWNHSNPQFESEEQKCDFVIAKYIFAFTLSAFLAWLSYDLAEFINEQVPLSSKGIMFFQMASVMIALVGVWGRAGWKIQSYSGESKAELLDAKISNILTIIGFFLSFCSFYLVPTT